MTFKKILLRLVQWSYPAIAAVYVVELIWLLFSTSNTGNGFLINELFLPPGIFFLLHLGALIYSLSIRKKYKDDPVARLLIGKTIRWSIPGLVAACVLGVGGFALLIWLIASALSQAGAPR